MVVELRGLATAIKEGTTTVQEAFRPQPQKSSSEEQAEQFMNQLKGGAQDVKPVDEQPADAQPQDGGQGGDLFNGEA